MTRFEYHAPQTWDEAAALLSRYGPDAKPLAGGTVLMNQVQRGLIAPAHVVSLDRIPGWDSFTVNGAITLGAGTTYRQLERLPALMQTHTALATAIRKVGSVQVRNVGTLAGNFCYASPAGDAVPPLLVMDATLTLYGPDGQRVVAADGFITGPKQTMLRPGELVRQIHAPALPPYTATAFLKAGRRQAMEISFVSVAARLTLTPDGKRCATARIALGAVAPTPIRARDAEKLLEGQSLRPEAFAEAAELAVKASSPVSDERASAEYRLHLVRVMTRRALEQCWRQLTEAVR